MKKIRPSPPKNKQTNFLYIERLKKKRLKKLFIGTKHKMRILSPVAQRRLDQLQLSCKLSTFSIDHSLEPLPIGCSAYNGVT